MSPLTTAEVVVSVLLVVAALALLFVYLRRHVIAGGKPIMACAMLVPGAARWRLGLLRFGPDTMDWFSVAGPSLRPVRTWQRPLLELGPPERIRQVVPGLPDTAVAVSAKYSEQTFGLALAPAAYTAMRSWLESAPPGFNVNVA
jgi:Protein of unknown function (DUF2550)